MEYRNRDEYIRKKLKDGLQEELQYLEDKRQIELECRTIMGDDMSKKMQCITDARNDAYIPGQGDRCSRI